MPREGEIIYKVIYKEGRGIGAVFPKSLHKTPSGILITGSISRAVYSGGCEIRFFCLPC
jgi:hypothetical protein